MAELLVVIPTYNERESLAAIVDRVRTAIPSADVLIVDDASPDGTGKIADNLAASDKSIAVLHRADKEGLGRAYLAAFDWALARGYVYVAEIDADGSHDPAELPRMLELAVAGADLVIGSRWVPGGAVLNWPPLRRAISRAGNTYARIVLRSRIHDLTAGYRIFRTSALRNLDLVHVASQGYCFQVELAWWLEQTGHLVQEHPITFVERTTGRSKMHSGIVIEALLRVTLWALKAPFGARKRSAVAS
ncbi:MAG: polyprenol monophosphomannose synthase [Salinibacterium sp.]|nr:MAG: polyprenol monophosphomannose synthase [Salinibacterium sp.]